MTADEFIKQARRDAGLSEAPHDDEVRIVSAQVTVPFAELLDAARARMGMTRSEAIRVALQRFLADAQRVGVTRNRAEKV